MDALTSNGKVKVEYSDPYGVYQLIASDLQSRLPLRTLNWTSSSRPTRSIDSLYVDLVPDEKTVAAGTAKRVTSTTATPGTPTSPPTSGEFKRQDSNVVKRERRHQIPGLRRTPYLKIYLLRCDDSETYKATARKAVREWIKTNSTGSSSSGSSNQDNHDAFEYMIVHVVLPEVQTGATWPTKASASVLEKLRSDFNSSSRNVPDRVVQVPAMKSLQVQGSTVDPIPSGPAKDLFLAESSKTWDDLIYKMKLLILNSFDSRVKQYEDDIKEKGMQRSLPGWNFCTFFVLKEGLARGFESVGLVDDALMGYDELSIELLSAIREDGSKDSKLFREHTQELLIQAETALQTGELPASRPNHKRLSKSILDIDNKPYRELILANNISIFDFRSYVFARQTQIMLRLAALSGKALTANASTVDLQSTRDPVVLADICWRAKEYFSDMARITRQDLKASFKADSGASEAELKARYNVVANMIASWTYKGAIDILDKTREPGLPDVDLAKTEDHQASTRASAATEGSGASSPDSTSGETSQDETIAMRQEEAVSTPPKEAVSSPPLRPKRRLSLNSIRQQTRDQTNYSAGLSSLAVERAELYLIARRALTSVAQRRDWLTTWPTASGDVVDGQLDDVSLDDPMPVPQVKKKDDVPVFTDSAVAGVLDVSMRAILADKATFYQHWEELSLLAFLLFDAAKVNKSVDLITADVAAVRVRLGDYAYATPFLRELGPRYASNQWHDLEVAVLDMYVFCLKELGEHEEFVPAALQMLAKTIKAKDVHPMSSALTLRSTSTPFSNMNIKIVVEASNKLSRLVQASLQSFFVDIELDRMTWHSQDNDEYGFTLQFRSQSPVDFQVDTIQVRMIGTGDSSSREIILASSSTHNCTQKPSSVRVSSKTMLPGWYLLDSITFLSGKIRFHHSYRPMSLSDRNLTSDSVAPEFMVWPATRACIVKAAVHDVIQLEEPRALVFQIESNSNDIETAKLLIKSGTAGLRVHTADAEIIQGSVQITKDQQPSSVSLAKIPPKSIVKIKVPYRIEGELRMVSIRTELSYTVRQKSFVYGTVHQLATQLPIGVNVQDIFKKSVLFSKFAVSTSSENPIRLLKSTLAKNAIYDVSSPSFESRSLMVFPRQPASLIYRIVRKTEAVVTPAKKLSLQIDYQCLDEHVVTKASKMLTAALDQSEHKTFKPLILAHFEARLERHVLETDMERVGLLEEATIPGYMDFEWDSILSILPDSVQESLAIWLQEWHETNESIDLGDDLEAITRHIGIPVEIPSVPILHTASLVMEKRPQSRPYNVGEIVIGELQISHTRIWSETSSKADEAFTFIYELDASSDSWLIAGQRRGEFWSKEDEIKTFPVMLMPLRAGKLMLPSLEIRPAGDGANERTACETDYQSQGSAIEIVPGITGISLDVVTSPSGGLDGEIKVLEVEREAQATA